MEQRFDPRWLAPTRCLAAAISPGAALGPMDSHLLGAPYAAAGDALPPAKSPHGWKLLAQVNFADAAGMLPAIFPRSGILQLFIDPDSCLGSDFDCMGENGRGHFHRFVPSPSMEAFDPRASEALRCTPAALSPDGECCMPLDKPAGMAFPPRFQDLLPTDGTGLAEHADVVAKIRAAGEEAEEQWFDLATPESSQLGGWAYFTQSDPRDPSEPWEVLLQLDSDGAFDMMWGDAGVGAVSVRRSDLERGDFSRMLFAWDCC